MKQRLIYLLQTTVSWLPTTVTCLLMSSTVSAQTNYDYSTLQRERLNRGTIAVRTADGKVAVSWRTLKSDPRGQAYDIYRNGKLLNSEPLTTGGTFFIDEHPSEGESIYEVRYRRGERKEERGERNEFRGERFVLRADAPVGYLPIPIQKPEGGKVPVIAQSAVRQGRWGGWRDDGSYSYTANDASVGDVDGDGQY